MEVNAGFSCFIFCAYALGKLSLGNSLTAGLWKRKRMPGKREISITDDVVAMFQAIIEDRKAPAVEKIIDGYSGFLFYDKV